MNTVNIGKLPVEITEVWGDYAELDIGGIPAKIIEPKPALLKQGVVYLCTTDYERGRWSELIACELNGHKLSGASTDPRLLEIASLVFHGKMTEKDVGKIFPPRE